MMGAFALAVGALTLAAALPHLTGVDRCPPRLAAATWLVALTARATLVALLAAAVVSALPATAALRQLSAWCLDSVLPMLTEGFPVNGHAVGDVTLLVPGLLLGASLISAAWGIWRATRHVARVLLWRGISGGPEGSVIVPDQAVLVAAAGLRRPCVVVSAGALLALDDQELAASLEHERGHIRLRHRFVLVVVALLSAVARPLPGTQRAAREIHHHLERDADDYAVRRTDAPALASAICKAALPAGAPSAPLLALSGGSVERRVRELLGETPSPGRTTLVMARAGLALLVALVIAGASLLPSALAAGVAAAGDGAPPHECPHTR